MLIKHGADLDPREWVRNGEEYPAKDPITPLDQEIMMGHSDIFRFFLEQEQFNFEGLFYSSTALRWAGEHCPSSIPLTLEKGASPNTVDRWGTSPLHAALKAGRLGAAQAFDRCWRPS